ncbi:MAG: serine/threonine protein kinase [Gemmatimonadota bacterium]|nr:serine/threonine protein kinase [Gemmatimonadota bacterium]
MDDPKRIRVLLASKYDVEHELGMGGMATVYLAKDHKHGREVALKVLRPELTESLGAKRFLNEIELAAKLNHPNILTLHDSGEVDGTLYYVMPFLPDGSLRQVLIKEGSLLEEQALPIACEVAEALDYAHRQGVIHRDIKPENILLSNGHALVADFGIAKALGKIAETRLTRSGIALGTPGYMSPEQAAGLTDLDERTDVYALGCVAYEMVVGETPGLWPTEEATRLGRFIDAPPDHREKLDLLPSRWEGAMVKALAMRKADRFPSPIDFAIALKVPGKTRRTFNEAEIDKIVADASKLEAREPSWTGRFSIKTVEQVAGDVGLGFDFVRLAVEELRNIRPEGGWQAS